MRELSSFVYFIFIFLLFLILPIIDPTTNKLCAHTPLSVPLPCLSNPCSPRLGFLQCPSILENIKRQVSSLVKQKINCFYQGVDMQLPTSTPTPTSCNGKPFETPVCNLLEGEITTVNQTNHPNPASPSCGNYKVLNINGLNAMNGNGTIEKAYENGFYTQAWNCFEQQVFNELTQNNALTVQQPSSLGSATADVSNSITSLLTSFSSGSQNILCNAPAACNYTGDFCSTPIPTPTPTPPPPNFQKNCQRIAVCQLMASTLQLQAAFTLLVYQEIETRTLASWIIKKGAIEISISNKITEQCNPGSCTPSGIAPSVMSVPGMNQIKDPSCIARTINQCYQQIYFSQMQSLIGQTYPSNGQCRP